MTPEKNDTVKEQIVGTVEKISFRNEDNGYTVCRITSKNKEYEGVAITLVGIMPMIKVGEIISAEGKWGFHRQYGRQFEVEYFEKQYPTDSAAILQYLSSKTVKGIGPATAAKIVGKFGENTFDVIENHPEQLAVINGISESKAREIAESFRQQKEFRAIMMFCRDMLGPSTAMKIHKHWGGRAIDIIRENPYMLCEEINGIGFEKADKVARSLGIEGNSPQRIRSGIIYVLSYNASANGHTVLPRDRLTALAADLLSVDKESCEDALDVLTDRKKTVVRMIEGRECVCLEKYMKAESYIKDKLDMLAAVFRKSKESDYIEVVSDIEKESRIAYDKMQQKAIRFSQESGVLLLTGGPGTGKTTVIKGIISLLKRRNKSFVLAAPTGRAAKRMTEATGEEALTIHRLLEMMPGDERGHYFARNSDNPISEDTVIVDEASMIDTLLMEALLRAVKLGSGIIIIGDSNQLPSIGAGNVFAELLRSERYNTVILKKIFRQAGESLIVTNAHAINAGEYPELYSKSGDFFFIEKENEEDIARTVTDLCVRRLPKKFGEEAVTGTQVITPSHRGAAGTEALNIMLQQALNPPKPGRREKKHRERVFREGDKVMQIKNDYDIEWQKNGEEGCGIFNGDIGIIISILADDEIMLIDFEGRLTRYDFSMLDELEHAYAITVHKSQGSEYPYVIIPVYNCTEKLLTRNLLYTAVTRAQKTVILVGKSRLVSAMVDNNRQAKRYTGLSEILSNGDNIYENRAVQENT